MAVKLKTLYDLADYLDALASDLPLIASNLAREVADAIALDIIQNTPIDVGSAMSNWIISLDSPVFEIRPAFVASPKGRMVSGTWTHKVPPVTTFFANIGPAQAEVEAVLELKQPGQPIHITNSEPYVNKLNEGYSTQAPAGYVDRALLIAETVIAKVRI